GRPAGALGRERAAGGAEPKTVGDRSALEPRVQEAGVEGVAGARGVDRPDRERGHLDRPALVERHRPFLPELRHRARAAVREPAEGLLGIVRPCDARELDLVWKEEVGLAERLLEASRPAFGRIVPGIEGRRQALAARGREEVADPRAQALLEVER